jgi:hypothetical protein
MKRRKAVAIAKRVFLVALSFLLVSLGGPKSSEAQTSSQFWNGFQVPIPQGYCIDRLSAERMGMRLCSGVRTSIDVGRLSSLDGLTAAQLNARFVSRMEEFRSGAKDESLLPEIQQEWGRCFTQQREVVRSAWASPHTFQVKFTFICHGRRGSNEVTMRAVQALIQTAGRGYYVSMDSGGLPIGEDRRAAFNSVRRAVTNPAVRN